jgi:molecular chaperone GrpE
MIPSSAHESDVPLDSPHEEGGEPVEVSPEAAEVIAQLQTERDEAVAARQRALADFANFQRRANDNESRARLHGAAAVVRPLIPALDHFDLALSQNTTQLTIDQLLSGVRIVRGEIARALESQGVRVIDPAIGEPFDPSRHQAMMRQVAEGVAAGHIVAVLQRGYSMGDIVLRPAQVAIAPDEPAS